jgi:hypothetical protein
MALEDEGEGARGDLCGRCGRICEPAEIETCPVCKTLFCLYCVYRIGSRNYCSRPCGDSFFFGDAIDDDDLPEE